MSPMDHVNNFEATELRLGLPGTTAGSKRALPGTTDTDDDCSLKVRVVGWPPVRSYRRSSSFQTKRAEAAAYVKVSMDGAPYLRKVHLKVYEGYKDLRVALEDMFNSFSIGEYVITYEDKDGDWMMVGDVPFEMFVSTCKRLRIMKGTEAKGLDSNP